MKPYKRKIRTIIRSVMKEDRESLKDTLDHEDVEDVIHATYHAWAGGNSGETEDANLVLPIDHSHAVGSEKVTKGVEVLDPVENKVISISESSLRKKVRTILRNLTY